MKKKGLNFLIFATIVFSAAVFIPNAVSQSGLVEGGATLVFERVTRIEMNNAASIIFKNGNKQQLDLVAVDLTQPKRKAAFDICERSAQLAMAHPNKYQFTVKIHPHTNYSTAEKTHYRLPIEQGGTGMFECSLEAK